MKNPDGTIYKGLPTWLFISGLTIAPVVATQIAWALGLAFWFRLAAAAIVMLSVLGAEVSMHRRERHRLVTRRRTPA